MISAAASPSEAPDFHRLPLHLALAEPAQHVPGDRSLDGYAGREFTDYGPEIWELYRLGALHAGVALTGRFEHETGAVDVRNVMREIDDARDEENARLMRMQAVE